MQSEWLYLGIFMLVSGFIPFAAIFVAFILSPKKPNRLKSSTYECGIETVGDSRVQYRASFYIFGLVFLIFDVEMVFLFPWALAYNELTIFGVLEGVLFILILIAGLLYAWRKGALEWK